MASAWTTHGGSWQIWWFTGRTIGRIMVVHATYLQSELGGRAADVADHDLPRGRGLDRDHLEAHLHQPTINSGAQISHVPV